VQFGIVERRAVSDNFISNNAAFRGLPTMIESNKISPSDMTPEARRREVADLIAQGFVRLRQGAGPVADGAEALPDLASCPTSAFMQTPLSTRRFE
jgi:hypothetical protein